MANSELFYLKWNNFQKNVRRMKDEEDLIDITFACEGKKIGAHKLVLYSCSPYFKDLLKDNKSAHPIFFFHDMSFDILKAIIEYMYLGEVHITNDNLKDFIRVAEALQIRGLSKDTTTTDELNVNDTASSIESNIQEDFTSVRKKHSLEHQLQSANKRLRIISEASLDEIEEEVQQPNIKRDASNLQPKVETLEFLDEHIQQQQTSVTKQPQSITYMNMDTFTEKNNSVSNQQQQHITTQFIQAGTSQQSHQQNPAQSVEYKSEDEIWVEKAIDIGNNSTTHSESTSPKSSKNSNKNSSGYKANCLTPRSCPVCARVYSNVSNLRQHMRLIHNPQAVVCPICSKHFNSDLYLKRHYASIHSINSSNSGDDEKGNTNASSATPGNNWNYSDNSTILHGPLNELERQ